MYKFRGFCPEPLLSGGEARSPIFSQPFQHNPNGLRPLYVRKRTGRDISTGRKTQARVKIHSPSPPHILIPQNEGQGNRSKRRKRRCVTLA